MKISDSAFYNFNDLKNTGGDWSAEESTTGETIFFNFCHFVDHSQCEGEKTESFGFTTPSVGSGTCTRITSDTPQAELVEEISRDNPKNLDQEQAGIRLTRTGGATCADDDDRVMSMTVDIWCNSEVTGAPKATGSAFNPEEEEVDPCNVHLEFEHASGCVALSMALFQYILGASMMGVGAFLLYFGEKVRKSFMRGIVNFATFVFVAAIFFKLNWFALVDPTEPYEHLSIVKGIVALIAAGVATVTMNWAFKKVLRLGPTFLGFLSGYWVAVYLIVSINGMGGLFTSTSASGASIDIIGPVWSAVLEFLVACLGGLIGYNFSFLFILAIQTFIGSYLLVRGSTFWLDLGFPNEIQLMQSASTE